MKDRTGFPTQPREIVLILAAAAILSHVAPAAAADPVPDARRLREQAASEKDGTRRLALLEEAASTDPADPRAWLDLAETRMDMGYAEEAEEALDGAKAIIKDVHGDQRRELIRDYALLRAWYEYERADFDEGVKWADMAVKAKAGLAGYLIGGLNRAPGIRSEREMMEFAGIFRPYDSNTNRMRNAGWILQMWMHFNNMAWLPPDVLGYREPRVKIAEHEMARSRDQGLLYEVNGEAALAVREYSRFLPYHPCPEGGWLRRLEGPVPGADPGFPAMPFWVNPGDGYVTGSLLAYEAHARRMMVAAVDPEERGAWAARVVRSGGAAVPRYPTRPWTRMWRGEAYLALGMTREAEEEITMARAWFDELELTEPRLDHLQGRVLLLEKNFRTALPVLERAAEAYPEDGGVWADLGVARAMLAGGGPAREAFDRALELDPSLGSAWHNRGLLNYREGRYEEAAADLGRAAALFPEDEKIRQDVGLVQQKLRALRR